jgi:Gram-negative bacterial TonB protein C-terminal
MTTYLLIALSTINILSYSQDTIYLDKNSNPTDKSHAEYFKIRYKGNKIFNRVVDETYYISGEKESESCYYYDPDGKTSIPISDGIQKTWHKNGILKSVYTTKEGKYNDTLKTFWDNGRLKRKDIYQNGKLMDGQCFDVSGNLIPHFDYEVMPQYPGGIQRLREDVYKNLQMPEYLKEHNIPYVQVIAKFFVYESGNVTDITIVKGYNKEVNDEVIRVISKLKKWSPGFKDGELVRIAYSIPLRFYSN